MKLQIIEFNGFDWDTGNIWKVQKHRVALTEIEVFFKQEVLVLGDAKHSKDEERFIAVGRSIDSRTLFVVFTIRTKEAKQLIRVVSASLKVTIIPAKNAALPR